MRRFTKGLSQSFRAAWRGFLHAFNGERTFRIMVAASLVIIILVSTLPLSSGERLMLLLVTGLVLVLELLNTMVERFIDMIKPRLSTYVRDVKDLMAAAVLVAAFFATLIGLLILIPHVTLLLKQI